MTERRRILSWFVVFVFAVSIFTALAHATIFGDVRGIVHDPQHRPIAAAEVVIKAASSDWQQTGKTSNEGAFLFQAVPLGEYAVKVTAQGFAPLEQHVIVNSGVMTDLHFQLSVASASEVIEVTDIAGVVNPESSSSETLVGRNQIATNPGADRTNSLQMITNFVPGAYMVHDMIHIRGGHQVSWMIDGVPVPNTNIASNIAPQFDPKDIDTLEVGRGGYSADMGDRTYGVFNVVPRSGFERNNEGELLLSYGSFHSTNDQISFGSHTPRFAYYFSLNGNRSELGLDTPIAHVIHDKQDGGGAFSSLIFNPDPADQLRLVMSGRMDHYQIPNDFDMESAGIRDLQNEHDAFVNFSWVHTLSDGVMLTFSPFFHGNRSALTGGPNDPVIPNQSTNSMYAGGQVTASVIKGNHNFRAGFVGYAERDKEFFGVVANDGSGAFLNQIAQPSGGTAAMFFEDQWKATTWLTLNGGLRLSHFSGAIEENAADPRIGAAIQIPAIHWVLRGFYGRYYQAPPLNTFSGTQLCPTNLPIDFQCLSLLDLADQSGFGFLPLRGERDEQYEAGLTIPVQRWALDFTAFRTHAKNFLDHDVIGNSGLFFPLTLDRARIRGGEATVRSPKLFGRAQFHLAYSHQFAEGKGARTGGLTDFSPPQDLFFLDHDQRDTLSAGYEVTLPWRSFSSGNFNYGKGFLNGNGPGHLSPHATFDFALGKSLGENWSAQFSALNVSNNRYLLDTSNTFGGTHFYEARQYSVELRYKFHY